MLVSFMLINMLYLFQIQIKNLAENMQLITKGFERVIQEKKLCKNDGHGSKKFRKVCMHIKLIRAIYGTCQRN